MTDSDRSDVYHVDCDECEWHYASKNEGTVVRQQEMHSRENGHSVSYDFPERDVKGAVPIGVLEDLADEWSQEAHEERGHTEYSIGLSHCADELQEVINDYGDTDE